MPLCPDLGRNRTLIFQDYDRERGKERHLPASLDALKQAIEGMADDRSSTLEIVFPANPNRSMVVNASDGNLAVGALLDDRGGGLTLIGDESAEGTIVCIVGGQTVPLPRRYLVNLEDALAVAEEFFRTGTVDTLSGRWDGPQGDGT